MTLETIWHIRSWQICVHQSASQNGADSNNLRGRVSGDDSHLKKDTSPRYILTKFQMMLFNKTC